jgi:integrase
MQMYFVFMLRHSAAASSVTICTISSYVKAKMHLQLSMRAIRKYSIVPIVGQFCPNRGTLLDEFTPRSGKANYVKQRGTKSYYRRVIPVRFRPFFDGKTEWMIELKGKTGAIRQAEAMALAHQHNEQMMVDWSKVVSQTRNELDGTANLRVDFSHDALPVDIRMPHIQFYRDGKLVKTHKFAFSNDPDFLRQAESDGFFSVTGQEMMAQIKFMGERVKGWRAKEPVAKELANLKMKNIARRIDSFGSAGADTLLSILPKMHEQNKPREATKRKHALAAKEFIGLHGNLALSNITKQQVTDYVAHVAGMTTNGKLLAPTTVAQRLETISAVLQFATSIDAIPFNPASAVRAPKDTRPRASKTFKAFEKHEIETLVTVATEIWIRRRYITGKTKLSRKTDMITALHLLVWTGARPEEICQLRLVDLDMSKMFVEITNLEDDNDFRERFIKNEQSVRIVPIHSCLASRMDQHLVHIKKASSSTLLFPSFEPELETGRYARTLSQEWTATLRKLVTNDPQKVLYSLRHSWAVESRRIGMPEWVRNLIMGHTNKEASHSAGRYGSSEDDLDIKREWLEKMICLRQDVTD